MKTKQTDPVQVRVVGTAAANIKQWAELTGWSEAKLVTHCVTLAFGDDAQRKPNPEAIAYLGKLSDAHGQVMAAEKIARERRKALKQVEVLP